MRKLSSECRLKPLKSQLDSLKHESHELDARRRELLEEVAKIDAIGVGGIILQFRVGPSPYEITENNIRLFMDKVAPEFKAQTAAAAE